MDRFALPSIGDRHCGEYCPLIDAGERALPPAAMVNADISNGTCYQAQYSETNGDFIPCGNVAFGNWPCCAAGDVCLGFEGANACYDANSQDISCLSSVAHNSHLVGLTWLTDFVTQPEILT